MRTAFKELFGVASIVLLGAAAQGASITTNLSINGSGTVSGLNVTATGTASLSGIGSGTLSSSFSLLSAASSGSAPLTIQITSGSPTGTLTATIAGSVALLGEVFAGTPNSSGPATITVTSGTGGFAGATGTFNVTAAGTGSGSTQSGGGTFTINGSGTLTLSGTSSGGGGATPTITQVQNNYSYILPGLPNYGIAPGSLFIVQGSALNGQPISALQSSAAPGLPTTLNATSISVTVGGVTTKPGIYYTSPTQLAAVLPSGTPVGTGTLTVTSNGQTSSPAPIQVVQSAFGIDTYYGNGSGLATVTDPNDSTGQTLITATHSLSPGAEFVLWGSGVGADTANTDLVYPLKQDNLTSIPMQVYIGGVSATIAYRGRSQYPGVDQVVVTIPQGVPTGCAVSILIVSGTVVSNGVTIPINPGGGACVDPTSPETPTQISTLSGKSNINFGFLAVVQTTNQGKTTDIAAAQFYNYTGAQFLSDTSSQVSIGSCTITPPAGLSGTIPTLPTGLDAGTLTVSGPSNLALTLMGIAQVPGIYEAMLPTIPANGGAYVFNNGSGGANVKGFNVTVNYPAPLTWTNQSSISTVSRANGQTINWQFGAAGTYVSISGSSTASGLSGLTVSFTCLAPVAAGTFNIPAAVLLALPAGTGTLTVENATNPTSFTASGLDVGFALAGTSFQIAPAYQ